MFEAGTETKIKIFILHNLTPEQKKIYIDLKLFFTNVQLLWLLL